MFRFTAFFLFTCALFSQQYTINTIVGQNPDGEGAGATTVRLWRPDGVAADGQGGYFVADSWNQRVRRVSANGIMTTIAGGGTEFPAEGIAGNRVRLFNPVGLAYESRSNTLYFSESSMNMIFALSLETGTLRPVAGSVTPGFSGDGGPALQARFSRPWGLALDLNRNLLIADRGNHRVRRIDLTTRVVTTIAGNGTAAFGGDAGPPANAQLNVPTHVAVGRDGSIYIADYGNYRIRRIVPTGSIETYAGNGQTRFSGDNGLALQAAIDAFAVAVDADGNVYISDVNFDRVRRVAGGSGIISTFIGTGRPGFSGDGAPANLAQVEEPSALAVDGTTLLLADRANHRVRRIDLADNVIRSIAGRTRFGGEGLPAVEALLSVPAGVTFDPQGNLVFSDQENHVIRRVGSDGSVVTVLGRGGSIGFGAENVPASSTQLALPAGLAFDTDGTFYFVDSGNLRVRRLDTTGAVRTVTGNDIYGAWGVAIDRRNRFLYFTDFIFHQILKLDLNQPNARPTVIAGSPNFTPGFRGDGGPASASQIRLPQGIAVAPNGDVYFCDFGNNRIRKIDTLGTITTVIGNGEVEIEAIDGPVTGGAASLPTDVAVDAQGVVYFTESSGRVRRIANNRVDTIGGLRVGGSSGFGGDGGVATLARLYSPLGLAVDSTGNVVVADSFNHRVRQLSVIRQQAPVAIEITRGNSQSGPVSQALPIPLTVRVLGANQTPLAGLRVTFAVVQGTATLGTPTATTGADGVASTTIVFGATAGAVQVSARVEGLNPAVFNLTATATGGGGGPIGPPRPAIARQGIIGVGSSVPAVRMLSPRGIVSIYGENFLPAGTAGRRVNFDTETVNGILPTRLLGVCVEIGAIRAPLLDVFPTQLNVIVPNLSTANAAVRVITNCDATTGELISEPEMVPVGLAAPEFLYAQVNSSGRNPVAAVDAVTGTFIGPESIPGLVNTQPGSILTIYATGFGGTDPIIAPGALATGVARLTASTVRIKLGDNFLAEEDILYVGASPGSLIYQVNLRVPAATPAGDLPIQIFIGEAASPANAFLAVAAPASAPN